MSDFYSRCLTCGVDLPRGCSFCTEAHKLRWKAEHDEEARPVVLIDEWPFVKRETVVSGAKERNTVSSGQREDSSPRVDLGGEIGPTVRSRAELLANHDPRTCEHRHCGPMPF